MRYVPISTREDHGQERERERETDSGRRERSSPLLQLKAVLGPWWGPLKEAFKTISLERASPLLPFFLILKPQVYIMTGVPP